MRAEKKCLYLVILLIVFCSRLLAQSDTVANDGSDNTANLSWVAAQGIVAPLAFARNDQVSSSPPQTPENKAQQTYPWRIGVYPVLAWAPIFGVSFTLPPVPSNPIETPSGSTSGSLNGAYFGGARLEQGKWSADALFMWTALHGERDVPQAKMSLDFIFGDALGGYEVYHGLYVEGGFRRIALNIDATAESETVSRSPGYWDPLVGLTYRRVLGKKWRILVHGDGGGFGVGSDVDVTAAARAEWQFAHHFGLAMGYGGMHFSESNTKEGETLTLNPTMHGPILGFGTFF
jgi:hypothetical protein